MAPGSYLPELPSRHSTASFWHRDPSAQLLGHRSTPTLPAHVDTVIIGSGITGAFAARELVAHGRRNVLMLEAREACFGATGRNGGHCQPGIWDAPPDIARFELSSFRLVESLIQTHSIACDWDVVGGLHAIYKPAVLAAAKKQIRCLNEHPDLRGAAVLIENRDELKARKIPNALAAVEQPNAARLWPYKLVVWILEHLLQSNQFNLQTNTPVTALQRGAGPGLWSVCTERGTISARQVLLATNAYTPYLLPALQHVLVPVRGQVAALQPPAAVSLEHTYVWMKGADHQYLIQSGTGSSTGLLVFGGERLAAPGGEEGISRDDSVNASVGAALRKGVVDCLTLADGSDGPVPDSLNAAYEWTGIMGYSRDGSPWLGQVPSSLLGQVADSETASTGLYVSAGYTGHGMPVAPQCAIHVARMMLGKQSVAEGTPPTDWLISQERIDRARNLDFPRTEEDILQLFSGDT